MRAAPEINKAGLHPHRKGFCDGIFGRPAESPWKDDGFTAMGKNRLYLNGYLEGQEAKRRMEANLFVRPKPQISAQEGA